MSQAKDREALKHAMDVIFNKAPRDVSVPQISVDAIKTYDQLTSRLMTAMNRMEQSIAEESEIRKELVAIADEIKLLKTRLTEQEKSIANMQKLDDLYERVSVRSRNQWVRAVESASGISIGTGIRYDGDMARVVTSGHQDSRRRGTTFTVGVTLGGPTRGEGTVGSHNGGRSCNGGC
jgi:lactam utilization protein B